tara:strand:+ start:265 stop:996 length:732 start_codon:yes stop_codon:yes gene_type:complete
MIVRLICLLLTYLFSVSVQATTKIVWSIQDEWPPYVIESGELKGIAYEIVSEAFAEQGYEIKHTKKPWSRALREVMTQRYDIALTVWKSSDRLEYLDFSDAYLINSLVFVTLNTHSFRYTGLESLAGKRVGVLRGYAYDDAFLSSDDFDRMDADDLATNVKKLRVGRIDALVADRAFFLWFLKRNDLDINDFSLIDEPLSENPLYIAISRDHPKKKIILSAFNAGLRALQSSGRINTILEKYE